MQIYKTSMVQEQSKYCQEHYEHFSFYQDVEDFVCKTVVLHLASTSPPPSKIPTYPSPLEKVPSTSSSKAPTESIYPSSSP